MEDAILQGNIKSSDLGDPLLQKKFEIILDIHNKKIINELSKINDRINELNEDINEIKKYINENKLRPKTELAIISESHRDNQNNLDKVKNDEQRPKPRYGNYKPEDVAIEKFFYFGNKK